jgi:hypothetical protein
MAVFSRSLVSHLANLGHRTDDLGSQGQPESGRRQRSSLDDRDIFYRYSRADNLLGSTPDRIAHHMRELPKPEANVRRGLPALRCESCLIYTVGLSRLSDGTAGLLSIRIPV